ncbi:uncharacterized protein LOC114246707 [Bombyx mandarina]|uniref:Uncharacterized protein LOC114246707 n=1 Tax=Bombyx mandarina TaxID=7092 RepID=A0A6J2K4G9_BOMMA|nr:uncharacterized protein LOC114246707 [Bombyx mandarina]
MDGWTLLIFFVCLTSITDSSPVMTRESLIKQINTQHFCANILKINNFYYSLAERKNLSGIPADISIHWKTGNIFFTKISEEMKMSLQVLRPSGEFETIKVAGLGQSTTVDNLNDIVYLATDNGVYKYKDDGSIQLYAALGEDVMYLAVSNDGGTMYIATWPQNRVHKLSNDGQKQEIFAPIPNGHGLTVDTRNNIYFVATKTSYILKNGESVPIKIKGLPTDKMTGIYVSRSDEVYAMDENSNLYVLEPENASARHLGTFSVNGVNSFAMDESDNILIGVKSAILKYKGYERDPCPQQKVNKKGKRHSRRRKTKKLTTTSTTEATEDYEEE